MDKFINKEWRNFPTSFNVFKKDRKTCTIGEGVFQISNEDIDWGKNAITPNSGYSSIVGSKLLTIMEEHDLTQHVNVPTHTQGNSNNILDRVLTNRPDLIKKLSIVDGVADYNTILIDINISPKRKCRPKRKIFIRNKADNAETLG